MLLYGRTMLKQIDHETYAYVYFDDLQPKYFKFTIHEMKNKSIWLANHKEFDVFTQGKTKHILLNKLVPDWVKNSLQ